MEDDNEFDKFMEDICRREEVARSRTTPAGEVNENEMAKRRRNELYRERWQNRITWGGNR
jgi:hypothetical protein